MFVSYAEAQILSSFSGPTPEVYGRYIDDRIGANSFSSEQLDSFLSLIISFHPTLEFCCTISTTFVAILDISISIHHSTLTNFIHYKPIDSHSYLNFSYSHSKHTKYAYPTPNYSVCAGSVVTTMTLRLSQLMVGQFILREYPQPPPYRFFQSTSVDSLLLSLPASTATRLPSPIILPFYFANVLFSEHPGDSSPAPSFRKPYLTHQSLPSNEVTSYLTFLTPA